MTQSQYRLSWSWTRPGRSVVDLYVLDFTSLLRVQLRFICFVFYVFNHLRHMFLFPNQAWFIAFLPSIERRRYVSRSRWFPHIPRLRLDPLDQKGHMGSLMHTWFPQLKHLTKFHLNSHWFPAKVPCQSILTFCLLPSVKVPYQSFLRFRWLLLSNLLFNFSFKFPLRFPLNFIACSF